LWLSMAQIWLDRAERARQSAASDASARGSVRRFAR
jgi:hypothetical protein